jgi:hypothetical protein
MFVNGWGVNSNIDGEFGSGVGVVGIHCKNQSEQINDQ